MASNTVAYLDLALKKLSEFFQVMIRCVFRLLEKILFTLGGKPTRNKIKQQTAQ